MTKQIDKIKANILTEAGKNKWDNRRTTSEFVDALGDEGIELITTMPTKHNGGDDWKEYERLEKAEAYKILFP